MMTLIKCIHTQQSVIAYSFFQLKREGSCFEWLTIVTDPQWTGITTTGSTSISIIPLYVREREREGGREGEIMNRIILYILPERTCIGRKEQKSWA